MNAKVKNVIKLLRTLPTNEIKNAVSLMRDDFKSEAVNILGCENSIDSIANAIGMQKYKSAV